jgi:hypothetical protein
MKLHNKNASDVKIVHKDDEGVDVSRFLVALLGAISLVYAMGSANERGIRFFFFCTTFRFSFPRAK